MADEPTVKGRAKRLAERQRYDKWKLPPLRIDMSICINCDACLRHCPPQFGAIFNHGIDVIIIPEWQPAPDDWWTEPATNDPYR